MSSVIISNTGNSKTSAGTRFIKVMEPNDVQESVRGPSGKTWPVLHIFLYGVGYQYQIAIKNQPIQTNFVDRTDGMHEWLYNYTNGKLQWSDWNMVSGPNKTYVLGFKFEPPDDLVVEIKLRFS
jgi:hypothetical protein